MNRGPTKWRILMLVLALGPAGAALAQSPPRPDPRSAAYQQATALFKKGIELFDNGYYLQAIAKFEAAHRLVGRPKIHLRIALCYKWLGKTITSIKHYRLYLKRSPRQPEKQEDRVLRRQVAMEVQNLTRLVGRLELSMSTPAGAEVRVNGRLIGRAPLRREMLVRPGTVNVTASARGYYLYKRTLGLESGRLARIRIALIKVRPRVIKVRVGPTPIYKRWWFWTAVGVLVAGGATGLGVGLGLKEKPRELIGIPLRHDGLVRGF